MHSRRRLLRPVLGALAILAASAGARAQIFNFYAANRTGDWSAAANWSGGVPGKNHVAIIPASSTVTLDASATLIALWIEGRLVAKAGVAIQLTADLIQVNGTKGALLAGTAAAPFTGRLDILLTDRHAEMIGRYGLESKQLGVTHGGTIELYGSETRQPWVRLHDFGSGGWQGDSAVLPTGFDKRTLRVAGNATGWQRGDRLAISSTDFDMNQAEVRDIESVQSASRFRLSADLAHRHYSGIESHGSNRSVDMRASVALLGRNIRIRGDTDAIRRWGGDVLLNGETGAPPTRAVFSFVEFAHMGKFGQMGRYPLHFHRNGNMTGRGVVRGCSFHHCYHRAIVVHGTFGALLTDNAVFETYGHAYFLEDGDEEGNVFLRNLGMNVRTPPVYDHPDNDGKLLGQAMRAWGNGQISYATTVGTAPETAYKFFRFHDQNPAVFWIPNIANRFEDNVAAGSDAYGFSWDFMSQEFDVAGREETRIARNHFFLRSNRAGGPRNQLVRQPGMFSFKNNVAHSCGRVGFFTDEDGAGRARPFVDSGGFSHLTLVFEACTAFKCRMAGIWYRQYGDARFFKCAVADTPLAVYVASEGFMEDEQNDAFIDRKAPYQPLFHKVVNWSWGSTGLPGAPSMSHIALHDSLVVGDSANAGDPGSIDWFAATGTRTPKLERTLPYARRRMPSFVTSRSGNRLLTQVVDRNAPGRRLWQVGVTVYDGLIGITGTDFVNFRDKWLSDTDERIAAVFVPHLVGQWSYVQSPKEVANAFLVDPRNYCSGLRFVDVDNRVAFVAPRATFDRKFGAFADDDTMGFWYGNALQDVVLHDLDGSLAGSPGYVLNEHNPLIRGAASVRVGNQRFPYLRHAPGLPIAMLQLEYPFDWNSTMHRTSLFRFIELRGATGKIPLYDVAASFVTSKWQRDRAVRDPSLSVPTNYEGLKRIFGANLLVGTGASCPLYEIRYERPSGQVVLPDSDFAVRLRFGIRDGGVRLKIPIDAKPSRVHTAAPPATGYGGAYLPVDAIQFRPSSNLRYRSIESIKHSTSLAAFDAAIANAWRYEAPSGSGGPGYLHLKLYMTPRPGVASAGPEYGGKEVILLIEQ